VIRQSDAGAGGDAVVPFPADEGVAETLQAVGLELINGGAPTDVNVLISEYVHPQGGYTWNAPFSKEIIVEGGGRLGIVTTADDSVNCVSRFEYEE